MHFHVASPFSSFLRTPAITWGSEKRESVPFHMSFGSESLGNYFRGDGRISAIPAIPQNPSTLNVKQGFETPAGDSSEMKLSR